MKTKQQIKKEKWNEVLEKAPDAAKFISEISLAFGKPIFLSVIVDGKELINTREINRLFSQNKYNNYIQYD